MANKHKNYLQTKEIELGLVEIPEVHEEPMEIEEPVAPTYTVKVTHPSLRRRQAPSLSAPVLGLITDQGQYEIFEEQDGWGKLEDNSWISLEFTTK